jgi:hypothetical protein
MMTAQPERMICLVFIVPLLGSILRRVASLGVTSRIYENNGVKGRFHRRGKLARGVVPVGGFGYARFKLPHD